MKFIDSAGSSYFPTHWLTFNDVLLKPQKSKFKSRNDKDISLICHIGTGQSFDIPIISANMDTVTGGEMAKAMCSQGGLGILHRFYKDKEQYIQEITSVVSCCGKVAFSVGCGPEWVSFTEEMTVRLGDNGENSLIACLDVAHGHMEQSLETVKELRNLKNVFVIAGNVATPEGVLDLAAAGAHCIKIGIGSGSICTTRIVTGHGVPQLSAIISAKQALEGEGFPSVGIIADGGIRNSGDIVKALAAGADAVMLGNMLAGCDETPGEIFTTSSGPLKMYRGQSSRHFLKDVGKMGVASEGEHLSIQAKGPLESIIKEITGGIRSGLTYSGVGDIYSLQKNGIFMEISDHAWVESMPHALMNS